ncbi:cyclopropane fatty acyl phospholipid synthase [bacterium]|nr:cyclopropane fatty acyl phospholipid synthase [bacterium]
MTRNERVVRELFAVAEIEINGHNPWDLKVKDQRFYKRVLTEGVLGFAESYISGWIVCEQMDDLIARLLRGDIKNKLKKNWGLLFHILKSRLFNLQVLSRSSQVAHVHYNLSNQFYELMLGKTMAYTAAYWKNAANLDEAQYNKYDLVCRKVQLKEGETVLELGCGWGGFAKYAAEKYGCKMVSVNISSEQVKYAKEFCKGLPVSVFHCDYRNHSVYNPDHIRFDKAVSIGMAEHVGPKNYRNLFDVVDRQLKDDGLFLLHTIGSDISLSTCEPFTHKYIFPNSVLPSIKQVGDAIEGHFVAEDLQNFGKYYFNTLKEWYNNYKKNWDTIRMFDPVKFDTRFDRIWSFYLLGGMGMAKSKANHLWQFVFSKKGFQELYEAVR